jgi:hypothetical protein
MMAWQANLFFVCALWRVFGLPLQPQCLGPLEVGMMCVSSSCGCAFQHCLQSLYFGFRKGGTCREDMKMRVHGSGVEAHAYNPNYLGGRDGEDGGQGEPEYKLVRLSQ